MTAKIKKPLLTDKTRNWLSKALFEGGLIVLAVVLGFWVNEWREGRQREADGQVAIERVVLELSNNRDTLARVLPYHEEVAERLRTMRASPPDAALVETFFSVAGQGFGDLRLSDEAWGTAVTRDSLAMSDFSDVQAIASVYNLAENGPLSSWNLLITFMTETSAFEPDENGVALTRFSFAYDELVSQEKYLLEEYNNILKQLESTQH